MTSVADPSDEPRPGPAAPGPEARSRGPDQPVASRRAVWRPTTTTRDRGRLRTWTMTGRGRGNRAGRRRAHAATVGQRHPPRAARAPRRSAHRGHPGRRARRRSESAEGRELRRAGSVNLVEDTMAWGDRVRPIARAGDAVEPLVIDDYGVEPAEDPVVGPELCCRADPARADRRPARRAHPDPAARHRVDRGRRLRALRWRLLCARPPADAGPGARCRRGAAAGDVRREVRRRTDQPTTGIRGRARHRHQRLHPLPPGAAPTGRC